MTDLSNPFLLNQELVIGNNSVNTFANSITIKLSNGLSLLDRITGSNIGDMTENGGLAGAFDGDTNPTFYLAAVKSNTSSAYVGKTLVSPSAITKTIIYAPKLVGFSSSDTFTAMLYVKNGVAPTTSVDGTLVGIVAAIPDTGGPQEIVSNNQVTLWDHVWVTTVPSVGPADMHIGEIEFFGYPEAAVIINSTSVVIGNSSVNTGITIPTIGQLVAGNYYLNADGTWQQVIGGPGGGIASKIYETFTATNGQTQFIVPGGYPINYIDVFYNGLHLASTDYTQDGSKVTLLAGANSGALIEVSGRMTLSNYDMIYETMVAIDGQTDFTVPGGYAVDYIDVYYNGIHLATTDYTQDGTTVALVAGANTGALIEVCGYKLTP